MELSSHWRRAETPRRGGSSGASRTRCSGSASRWLSDAGVRVSRLDRRDCCAWIQGPALDLVVALMDIPCARCGYALGIEADVFEAYRSVRLRCPRCGGLVRVTRRVEVWYHAEDISPDYPVEVKPK